MPDQPRDPIRLMPRQERSRQRVDQILDAAMELLREGGYDACTMSNIASRAGVTPQSVYRYFPDRSAIIQALYEATAAVITAEMTENLRRVDSLDVAREAVAQAFRDYALVFRHDRAMRELWTSINIDPQLAAFNVADSRRNAQIVAQHIGPYSGLDAETLAARSFLFTHLAGHAALLMLDVEDSEAAAIEAECFRLFSSLF